MERYPRSHLPRVGLAFLARAQAWHARGDGWASTVPRKAWPAFEERLEEAWAWMTEALSDDPRDPQFYSEMIDFCRNTGCPRASADAWLRRGLEINPLMVSLTCRCVGEVSDRQLVPLLAAPAGAETALKPGSGRAPRAAGGR